MGRNLNIPSSLPSFHRNGMFMSLTMAGEHHTLFLQISKSHLLGEFMLTLAITLAAFFLLIALIIAIHEGGHYLAAVLCNVKILRFSIGFGKVLFSRKFGKDQTEFSLSALPLGGYVKPLDKGSTEEAVWAGLSEEDKKRSYDSAPRWKKMIIVAGGPLSNFVLALAVYFLLFAGLGLKGMAPRIDEVISGSISANAGIHSGQVIEAINGERMVTANEVYGALANLAVSQGQVNVRTEDGKIHLLDFSNIQLARMEHDFADMLGIYFAGPSGNIIIEHVEDGSIAEKAGMQKGDIILQAGRYDQPTLGQIIRSIQKSPNRTVEFKVKRDNNILTIATTPESKIERGIAVGKIGIKFKPENQEAWEAQFAEQRYGPSAAAVKSIAKVGEVTQSTLQAIVKLATGQLSVKSLSGPIAIADYAGQAAQKGLQVYLYFMASISIAVGVFNLLPIPMLDGGLLIQYSIESLIRREIPEKAQKAFQFVGLTVLASLFSFAMYNDINKMLMSWLN